MKIALVGPGLMSIPPKGWGAIEVLIWKYSEALKKEGHEVVIYNTQNLDEVINSINSSNFDFVHVHYDEFIHPFLKKCKVPFAITSHFGYITKPEKWPLGYFHIFIDFLKAPHIIALSQEIRNLYQKFNYQGDISVLRNGIDVEQFLFNGNGNGKVICLGKIEPRKRQVELVETVDGVVDIDFVGPLEDFRFKEGKTCHYRGVWTRDEVIKNLTNYSTLVLLSEGEAAPLVVVEALAAGLSVVISKSSAANLDEKPFITILKDSEINQEVIISALKESVENNNKFRKQIREYASVKFDNSVIFKEYELLIKNFIDKKYKIIKNSSNKNKFFIKYYISRYKFLLSRNYYFRLIRVFLKK